MPLRAKSGGDWQPTLRLGSGQLSPQLLAQVAHSVPFADLPQYSTTAAGQAARAFGGGD